MSTFERFSIFFLRVICLGTEANQTPILDIILQWKAFKDIFQHNLLKTLNFINTFWKSQLYNFVWTLNQVFLFRYLLYLSHLSLFLFCFWLVYSSIVLFWLVCSISVWFLLYFVQYYTLKNDRIRENPKKKRFPRIGPFFRVYSLSIRLSLQRTRHTNQTSAHIHLWTKFFPPSLFLCCHTLH